MGVGAMVGATPVLLVHTWLAAGVAAALRLPPLAAVLGSNVSNPLTFAPLTLLELRVGSWLLGREFEALPHSLSPGDLGPYAAAAWLGAVPVGLAMGLVSGAISYVLLRRRRGGEGISGEAPEDRSPNTEE